MEPFGSCSSSPAAGDHDQPPECATDHRQTIISQVEFIKINDDDDQRRFPSAASLDILMDLFFDSSSKKVKRKMEPATYCGGNATITGSSILSTDKILKFAGARIIRSSTGEENYDFLPLILDDEADHRGLTHEESKNVELMEYLLRSAEKFGREEFEQANGLLDLCNSLGCHPTGNPVQRTAYYFCSALRQKIADRTNTSFFVDNHGMKLFPAVEYSYFHGRVPFFMASQLAGVQAIVESVASDVRIHMVDLKIGSGLPIIALMQALSGRAANGLLPIELLKVTTVANDASEEEVCQETGERLASFAGEMSVPFTFVIAKAQANILKRSQLQLHPKEARVIYSEYALSPMLSTPNRLHALILLVQRLHPRLMVVIDTEANHNSPDFGHRFVEALFNTAAYFDCLAKCCTADDDKEDNPTTIAAAREALEARYLGERIRNLVAAEGEKRVVRHVKIDVWRKYFARCGMLEIELSELAVHHARLVVNRFPCGGSCLVGEDGKSLVMGWKDTPLLFVSTWKFVGSRKARPAAKRDGHPPI